jgi:hypothetical protein
MAMNRYGVRFGEIKEPRHWIKASPLLVKNTCLRGDARSLPKPLYSLCLW